MNDKENAAGTVMRSGHEGEIEELAARAAELEALYAAQNDAVLIYDKGMFVRRVNPAFLSTYGFDPVGMHVGDIMRAVSCRSMDGKPLVLADQPTPRALRGEKVMSSCYLITKPSDGSEIIVEASSGPMRVGERIIGSATVWHDITAQKRMEKELRESRHELSAIVESIADGFYTIDRDWRFTHVNDEAMSYFGLGRDEMLGRSIFEVFPRFGGSLFEQEFRKAMKTGETVHFEAPSVVRERVVEMHVYPGQENLSVLFRDVSERHALEDNLRRSEARFRLLSETAGALLATEDPQAVIETLCKRVMDHLDCQAFFNFLLDETEGRLRLNACAGIPKEEARRIEWLDFGVAVCGCVAQQGMRIISEDIRNTPDPRTELVKSYGIQAYCCHPLMARGLVMGTLSFGTKTRPHFSEDEIALMKTVADQVAIAMERIHAQNALKSALEEAEEGRRTLQALMDNVPEGITIADAPDVNILMVSRYGREILGGWHEGITAGDVARKWQIFHKDGATPMETEQLPLVRAIRKGEIIRDVELMQVNEEGRRLPLLCNAAPIRDLEGGIIGGIVAWRDISELKKREDELNKLNRTLRALSGSNQAMMRCPDEDQFLQEVCRVVVEDCGYSLVWIGYAEDDEEKTVRPMAYAGFDEGYIRGLSITWADNERGRGPTGMAIRTGRPCGCSNMLADPSFAPWRAEALKRGYASSLVLPLMVSEKPFGAMTIYSGEPDHFSNDEIRLLSDLASDLSTGISAFRLSKAHKLAEEALRKSEQRFSSLFSAMTEGFAIHEIILDGQGTPVDYRFLDINPSFERLTGLKRDEVVGRTKNEVLPYDDPHWVEVYGKVALTGEPAHLENYSSALRRWYDVFAYCPAPLQFAVVFMDITRRKEAEEEVRRHQDHLEELVKERTAQLETRNLQLELEITERRRAEEEKKSLEAQLIQTQKMEALGRFAGGIAHDLNNILYPIIINTQMLLDETTPDTVMHQTLSQLLGAAYRQRDLIRQILSFSRRSDQLLAPVKVRPLIKETLVLLKSLLPPTIEIKPLLDVSSDKVLGDATQIQQIIMNLVKNAVDAIGQEKGAIEVGLGNIRIDGNPPHPALKPGEYLQLTVRDNGCGMAPDVIDRIFEPFFTTKEVGKGSGMGLAVIHGIIKGHRGAITVESEPGKGALFTVCIPLTGDSPRKKAAQSDSTASRTRARVLFVDDEDIIIYSVNRVLKILGYEVVSKKDGREALQEFSAAPGSFDLVLTDLTMPHMNGMELASRIRELRADIPVILCTGFSDSVDRKKAGEMGICELLMKPADIDELKAVMNRVLGKG